MKTLVLGTPHESFLMLKFIQHSTTYPNVYVDLILLTEGLTSEQIVKLRKTQDDPHTHYCCYKEGGEGNLGAIEPMVNGFARIIIHS